MSAKAKRIWDKILAYADKKSEADTPKTRHKKKSNRMPKAPTNPYAKQLIRRTLAAKTQEGVQGADQFIDGQLLAAERIMYRLFGGSDEALAVKTEENHFIPITTPHGSPDEKMFTEIVNQGIDSYLEGFTKSTFEHTDERLVLNFHVSELPILVRRLDMLENEDADSWAQDIRDLPEYPGDFPKGADDVDASQERLPNVASYVKKHSIQADMDRFIIQDINDNTILDFRPFKTREEAEKWKEGHLIGSEYRVIEIPDDVAGVPDYNRVNQEDEEGFEASKKINGKDMWYWPEEEGREAGWREEEPSESQKKHGDDMREMVRQALTKKDEPKVKAEGKEINIGDAFWDRDEDDEAMAFSVIDKGTPEEVFERNPGAKEDWDRGSSEGTKGHDTIYMIHYSGYGDDIKMPVGEPWLRELRPADPSEVTGGLRAGAGEPDVEDWREQTGQPRYAPEGKRPGGFKHKRDSDEWLRLKEDMKKRREQGRKDSESRKKAGYEANQKVKAARTITIPTDELKEAFGFPVDIDKDFYYEAPDYPESDIIYNLERIDEELKGVDEDTQEPAYSDQQIDAMRSALVSAEESAFYSDTEKAIKDAVERVLTEDFSDYQYEYLAIGDESGSESFSGTAKGIISAEVGWDETVLTLDDDFAHIIRDILSGDGNFDPAALPLDASDEEIKGHLHWLPRYYDIYGGRKPEPNYSDYPDVDQEYLKTVYQEQLAEQAAPEDS